MSQIDHWQLDKRISISQIVTTLTVAAGLVWWIAQLNERVTVNEVRIEQIHVDDARQREVIATKFEDIKVSLLRIEDKLDDKADR